MMFFISRFNHTESHVQEDAKPLYEQLTDENQELEFSILQELSDGEAESIKGGKILYPYIVRFDSPRESSTLLEIEQIEVDRNTGGSYYDYATGALN